MAALGEIRKKGVLLVIIIGLGLFAFIAEEAFRSCETTKNVARQQIGEVLGQKMSVGDFQELVDEYLEVLKITQGRENFSEDENNQIKDLIWNQYVSNKITEAEAEKLGLTVTDQEIQDILNEGTNPMLTNTPFVNQQTRLFDVNQLKQFLDSYKKISQNSASQNVQLVEQYQRLYNYWKFIEKNLRLQTLSMKYQALITGCLISNPISAKMAYDGKNIESNIQLASIAYSTINDNKVEVSGADLKAKYKEQKEAFLQPQETRDIKFVDFQVLPSVADRDALMKQMKEASVQLSGGADPAEVVRKNQSQLSYLGVPVSKKSLPSDIAAKIDSISVGTTTEPFETKRDNTLNVVKLIAKTEQPDSIEYRQISIGGESLDAARKRADSVVAALRGGADFEVIAQRYGQNGTKQWFTGSLYERSSSLDEETKKFITAITNGVKGDIQNMEFTQGNLVLQVLDRKAMTPKYDVATVKHTIDFSKGTYSTAYNNFSQYVSESQSLDALEKNAAKFGFKVQTRNDIYNSGHNIANIHSSHEAMKWVFDAKEGEISPLYECGDNDHLLVVVLTKIHPQGYRSLDDVKETLKDEVLRDKKFEMISAGLKGVKNIAGAKSKGAEVNDVNQVTFSAPVFVQVTGTSEPALSGAVAAVKQGQFSPKPVKGNGGAFLFQVVKKETNLMTYNEKQQEQMLSQEAVQSASRFMYELQLKANVVDNRYLFF